MYIYVFDRRFYPPHIAVLGCIHFKSVHTIPGNQTHTLGVALVNHISIFLKKPFRLEVCYLLQEELFGLLTLR